MGDTEAETDPALPLHLDASAPPPLTPTLSEGARTLAVRHRQGHGLHLEHLHVVLALALQKTGEMARTHVVPLLLVAQFPGHARAPDLPRIDLAVATMLPTASANVHEQETDGRPSTTNGRFLEERSGGDDPLRSAL